MKNLALYIHIPFCEKKCHYCDFISTPTNKDLQEKYFSYLLKEVSMLKDKARGYKVDSVFIGGGTPSVLEGEKIEILLETLNKDFEISKDAEITIEVNPGTLNNNKAISYKKAGITRLSLGIQSMNDKTLKSIGRIHNKTDVIRTLQILKENSFSNISGDLIFGLPNEDLEDFKRSLKEVIDLGLSHISMYGLILEEGTLMYTWKQKGLLKMPSEEEERKMYHEGVEFLEENNFIQYEISNFAKLGFESKHNIGYWELKPYLGLGLGSHSNIDDKRYWNESKFDMYFKKIQEGKLPIGGSESIDIKLKEAEYLILAIRMNKGIIKKDYEDKFSHILMEKYKDPIERHIKNDLLIDTGPSIKLSKKGLDLSNLVEVDFI